MRLRNVAKSAAILLVAAMAGCSDGGDTADESTPPEAPPAVSGQAAALQPDPAAEPAESEIALANPVPAPALNCPSEQGIFCKGPLIIRAPQVTLSRSRRPYDDGSQELVATVTFSVENRSASPLRFGLLQENMNFSLDNGAVLRGGGSTRNFSGITPCRNDGATCLQGSPDDFVTVAPEDSPATFGIVFEGRSDGSLAATLPSIAAGDIGLQLYLVSTAGEGQKFQVGLTRVPIRNQLAL